jgi:hypothetical protein
MVGRVKMSIWLYKLGRVLPSSIGWRKGKSMVTNGHIPPMSLVSKIREATVRVNQFQQSDVAIIIYIYQPTAPCHLYAYRSRALPNLSYPPCFESQHLK